MKGSATLRMAIFASLSLGACANDVDLLEDVAPVPVVYGLYNASATEQVVSVSKTFRFAPDGGAVEAARDADSVYYRPESLTVYVESERTGSRAEATRFSASDAGVRRDTGVFGGAPNYLYRYDTEGLDLRPGDELQLHLERDGNELASGRASVLPEQTFIANREPPSNYGFTSDRDFTFSWRGNNEGEEIQLYEAGFNFVYSEQRDDVFEARVLYWPAATNLPAESTFSVPIDGLFDYLVANVEVDPDVVRTFNYVQLVITGGDASFVDLQTLLRANTGITSTQELPPFSNIEGGLGLFGGITQLRQDSSGSLSPASFDELYNGAGLRELNFRP